MLVSLTVSDVTALFCIARNSVAIRLAGISDKTGALQMEDVSALELNLPTSPCSTLRAPLRLSFGDCALRGTFSSAPEFHASSAHIDPAVHQSVLLLQQAECMHPSPATLAAPSADPLLLPADRGASYQSLPLQLPSAQPLKRSIYNFAAQQSNTHVDPCACMSWSPRADTYVFCENVVESVDSLMCDACSTGAIPCECTCNGCRGGDCELLFFREILKEC